MRSLQLGLAISLTPSKSSPSFPSNKLHFHPSNLSHYASLTSSSSSSNFSDSEPEVVKPKEAKRKSKKKNKGKQTQSEATEGICRASQIADLFPTVSPEVVVREARLDDCWEVVETHCSSFFPEYSFPLDFVLRIDRLVAMIFGFSVPSGCKRTCLVAVVGSSEDTFYFESEDLKFGGFDAKFSLNRGRVAGILTVDTVADFLPRKGPLRQRRKGIAYISNVAVREKFRRKGIAKRLIAKAEAHALNWGCSAVALHCDLNNPGATHLYKSQGYRCIKVPEGANWPQPKTSPDIQFNFMMKLVTSKIPNHNIG